MNVHLDFVRTRVYRWLERARYDRSQHSFWLRRKGYGSHLQIDAFAMECFLVTQLKCRSRIAMSLKYA